MQWNCLKVLFYIKDVTATKATKTVNNILSIQYAFDSILDIAHVPLEDKFLTSSFVSLYKNDCCENTFNNLNEPNKLNSSLTEDNRNQLHLNLAESSHFTCSKHFEDNQPFLFHYYNIHRPVLITYRGRFQVIYSSLSMI